MGKDAMNLMLDSHIFDRLIDGRLPTDAFAVHTVFITHVQLDELSRVSNKERQRLLLQRLQAVAPTSVSTTTAVWGISLLDKSNWTNNSRQFDCMVSSLKQLDKKNKKLENQLRDILIAQTAIDNGYCLVSDDSNLRTVTRDFGGHTVCSNRLKHLTQ